MSPATGTETGETIGTAVVQAALTVATAVLSSWEPTGLSAIMAAAVHSASIPFNTAALDDDVVVVGVVASVFGFVAPVDTVILKHARTPYYREHWLRETRNTFRGNRIVEVGKPSMISFLALNPMRTPAKASGYNRYWKHWQGLWMPPPHGAIDLKAFFDNGW